MPENIFKTLLNSGKLRMRMTDFSMLVTDPGHPAWGTGQPEGAHREEHTRISPERYSPAKTYPQFQLAGRDTR